MRTVHCGLSPSLHTGLLGYIFIRLRPCFLGQISVKYLSSSYITVLVQVGWASPEMRLSNTELSRELLGHKEGPLTQPLHLLPFISSCLVSKPLVSLFPESEALWHKEAPTLLGLSSPLPPLPSPPQPCSLDFKRRSQPLSKSPTSIPWPVLPALLMPTSEQAWPPFVSQPRPEPKEKAGNFPSSK